MDNSTARKKEVQMSGKLANFRSWVFSIIKIKYGWNGCIPDGCDPEQWETLIEKGHDNTVFSDEIAHEIVDDIYLHGGTFRQRLDGKPNTLVPTGYVCKCGRIQ